MDIIKKICINCPAGCHLEIIDNADGISVCGNRCPRGIKYAENELRNPCRIVTCSVLADAPERRCIPVKSSSAVPIGMIKSLLDDLSKMRIKLPVAIGDKIIENYKNTNIDIIASGDLK